MRVPAIVLLLTFIVSVLAASAAAASAGTQNTEELRLAAEQGDADAQVRLGGAYHQAARGRSLFAEPTCSGSLAMSD